MLGYKEVGEILTIIDSSSCDEFVLETRDVKLVVRRRGGRSDPSEIDAPSVTAARSESADSAGMATAHASARTTPNSGATSPPAAAGAEVVRAPMVGTFYRASSPDESPFVEVGTRVKQGDPLCMIEVMKLFTTVHADVDGVIQDIGAENGQLVEFGQVLFNIEAV
jgi:acetyl-CoA carboxylase biotin carboxyl carrier protein